jgi:hypothetical protein
MAAAAAAPSKAVLSAVDLEGVMREAMELAKLESEVCAVLKGCSRASDALAQVRIAIVGEKQEGSGEDDDEDGIEWGAEGWLVDESSEACQRFLCQRVVPALALASVPDFSRASNRRQQAKAARFACAAADILERLQEANGGPRSLIRWARQLRLDLAMGLSVPPPSVAELASDPFEDSRPLMRRYAPCLERAIEMVHSCKGDEQDERLGRWAVKAIVRSWMLVYDLIGGHKLLDHVRAGNAMLRPLTRCFNGCALLNSSGHAVPAVELAAAAFGPWRLVIHAAFDRGELAARTPLLLQPIRFALAQHERWAAARAGLDATEAQRDRMAEPAESLQHAALDAWHLILRSVKREPRKLLGYRTFANEAEADAAMIKAYLAIVEPIARRFLMAPAQEAAVAAEAPAAAATEQPAQAAPPPAPRPPPPTQDEASQDPVVAAALAAAAGNVRAVAVGGFATADGAGAGHASAPALAQLCEARRRLLAQRDRCVDDGDPAPPVRPHDAFGADAPASQAAAAAALAQQQQQPQRHQKKRQRVLRIGLATGVPGIDGGGDGGSLPPAPLLDPGSTMGDDDDDEDEEEQQHADAAAAPVADAADAPAEPPAPATSARRDQQQQQQQQQQQPPRAAPMMLDTQRSCCAMMPPPPPPPPKAAGARAAAAQGEDDDPPPLPAADQGALRPRWPPSAMAEEPDGVEALEVADPATQLLPPLMLAQPHGGPAPRRPLAPAPPAQAANSLATALLSGAAGIVSAAGGAVVVPEEDALALLRAAHAAVVVGRRGGGASAKEEGDDDDDGRERLRLRRRAALLELNRAALALAAVAAERLAE